LTFHYVSGITFNDVIAGLNATNPANRLEIGYHVTGYASSASVVTWGTTPGPVGTSQNPPPVPLPVPFVAGAVLMSGMAGYRRLTASARNR
jgi:hypothetical protein